MRSRSLAALLVALIVGVVAAGAAASTSAPERSVAAKQPVTYLFKARLLRLNYELEWVREEGRRYEACSRWSVNRGSTTLIARSIKVLRSQSDAMPGRLTIYPGVQRDSRSRRWKWADGNAVGGMRVTFTRQHAYEGGITACGDEPAVPDPAPESDCGGVKTYRAAAGVLLPDVVRDRYFLDDLQSSAAVSARTGVRILAVSAVSQSRTPLYKSCTSTADAPETVEALPIVVRSGDQEALRTLRPGRRYTVRSNSTGPCKRDLSQTETCRYEISATLEIERWKPGTTFP